MKMSNKYMNDYMKTRYLRRRLEVIEKLGGRCVNCGSTDSLEFDHIDESTKEFTIAKGSSFSEERWQAEIAKCQLLCKTCHITKHSSDFPCGDVRKYWRGCRCSQCRAANARHSREYKRRRRSLNRETD